MQFLPGVVNLLIFGISVIAAVLAIDMYALLKTGELGQTWRILVVASVLFVAVQVVKISGNLIGPDVAAQLSHVVELVFIIALAYAFYKQRAIYQCHYREDKNSPQDQESGDDLPG